MDKPSDITSRRKNTEITLWLESQRGRRAWQAAPRSDKAISKIMRPLAKKFGAGSTGLANCWEEVVGPRLARISKPMRFQGDRDGRTLIISAPGPAAALIMASSNQIIDRANGYLGPGYLRRVKVIQTRITDTELSGSRQHKSADLTPLQKNALHSSLENIKDDGLKQALNNLGSQILAQQHVKDE